MNKRSNDIQREATQAAIDYLYRNKRDDPEFQLHILARLLEANGCTSAPDLCFGDCCNAHDVEYGTGRTIHGEPVTRAEADKRLMRCMSERAKKDKQAAEILAPIYYAAVRVFGECHWFYYEPPVFQEPLGD